MLASCWWFLCKREKWKKWARAHSGVPVWACSCSCSACGVPRLTSGAQWSERSWNRAEQARGAEREATRGAGGWQAAAESWNSLPVATHAAVTETTTTTRSSSSSSSSNHPLIRPSLPTGRRRRLELQSSLDESLQGRLWHICGNLAFSPFTPFTSELHR